MDVGLHYCKRCGKDLVSPEEPCNACQLIDQQTAHWSPERVEAFLVKERETHARARETVAGEVAGLTEDEFMAREEAWAALEPDIPAPAVAHSGKSLAEMNPTEQEEVRRWSEERRYALPRGVLPMPTTRIVHGCTELTTEDGQPLPGIALAFDQQAWWWGSDGAEPQWFNAFPWSYLVALEIEGPETVEQRVTLPRAAALGLFSLGFKKKQKRSYLILNTRGGTRLFEIDGMTPWELRGHLAPVADWLGQYSQQIQALD